MCQKSFHLTFYRSFGSKAGWRLASARHSTSHLPAKLLDHQPWRIRKIAPPGQRSFLRQERSVGQSDWRCRTDTSLRHMCRAGTQRLGVGEHTVHGVRDLDYLVAGEMHGLGGPLKKSENSKCPTWQAGLSSAPRNLYNRLFSQPRSNSENSGPLHGRASPAMLGTLDPRNRKLRENVESHSQKVTMKFWIAFLGCSQNNYL